MDEDVTGSGGRLGKRPSESGIEVDYKTKVGTAWSHSYLNQKPWHPLSYPNQRRKWIAEQTHSNHAHRAEEVAREFAQEQEFFRQTALFSKKEKEKVEMMKAVSFMYVRPPGYNPESAKAAEIADEQKRLDQTSEEQNPTEGTNSIKPDMKTAKSRAGDKKPRPKDVFGRPLPTEEEFEVLKNAPRLETGVPVRIKPFGVEIRNVRCVRCGTFGHQSGDRECPLKDVIMPNEESRLKRDDPLTAMMAQTDSSEPLKWELKQKPGMSPPRGGFRPDDPNQQIVAEDIFDEYGGFLGGGEIPPLLSNFSAGKSKKYSKRKSKHNPRSSRSHNEHEKHRDGDQSSSSLDSYESESDKESRQRSKSKYKKKHQTHTSISTDSEVKVDKERKDSESKHKKRRHRESSSSADTETDRRRRKSARKAKDLHDPIRTAKVPQQQHLPACCLSKFPMPKLLTRQGRRTNPLIWMLAIVCAILATAVIITGIVVFVIYMVYKPKMPYIKVAYAQLNHLDYDPSGLLKIQMALDVVAENDNKEARDGFSDLSFLLRFHGINVAELRADPLDVAKHSSSELNYRFQSSPAPLDKKAMEAMEVALRRGVVPFDLDGHARTRWRAGLFLSVRFTTHLSCPLNFSVRNGTAIDLDCSSKSR
ncbi:hypothetical protein OPV22_009600 [Ensete ventricosum]|uniref:CBF1-interacting co-repressor CIR N-terminal domain-containing protein n=1 Tax=Ensete ventricosum TaxID=4639 RepID=A0AAV8RJ98_ENSVE|nr:hypothetical protein OPV22_009600 [Ensete ventricosum]